MADLSSSTFSPSGQYDIGSPGNRAGNVFCAAGAVTQATSVSTAVTLNATSGVITMFAGTIAQASTVSFTVNNAYVTAGSAVTVSVSGFAGTYQTNGIPYATAGTVAAGSFVVNVTNLHSANPTGANAIKVSFEIAG